MFELDKTVHQGARVLYLQHRLLTTWDLGLQIIAHSFCPPLQSEISLREMAAENAESTRFAARGYVDLCSPVGGPRCPRQSWPYKMG